MLRSMAVARSWTAVVRSLMPKSRAVATEPSLFQRRFEACQSLWVQRGPGPGGAGPGSRGGGGGRGACPHAREVRQPLCQLGAFLDVALQLRPGVGDANTVNDATSGCTWRRGASKPSAARWRRASASPAARAWAGSGTGTRTGRRGRDRCRLRPSGPRTSTRRVSPGPAPRRPGHRASAGVVGRRVPRPGPLVCGLRCGGASRRGGGGTVPRRPPPTGGGGCATRRGPGRRCL